MGGTLTIVRLQDLDNAVVECRRCPRLVAWRESAATQSRARAEEYWSRPVPGFGPADARIAVIGLAPALHGSNRTGRMFTGDRSGDFLFEALHAVGLASQPHAVSRDDGMRLYDTRMAAPVRCAPPENKPTPEERDNCRPWLAQELQLLRPTLRAAVVLGAFGWQALLPVLSAACWRVPKPRPVFGHGVELRLEATDGGAPLTLLGCFHVSPHNTFTGRLTQQMVRDVFERAKAVADDQE
ncbi:uracil-DNA glycosylase [Kutzneria buriramensis]|uniref:uracil-DNA glycosylase n=1 Tax=Kutzneria buriramensis TaxID=1045776 RepID=UPI000E256118|nr:uracil-DNA glycosylase [Kutzneria buriramensis]